MGLKSQQTRDVKRTLAWCWSSVVDNGPTSSQSFFGSTSRVCGNEPAFCEWSSFSGYVERFKLPITCSLNRPTSQFRTLTFTDDHITNGRTGGMGVRQPASTIIIKTVVQYWVDVASFIGQRCLLWASASPTRDTCGGYVYNLVIYCLMTMPPCSKHYFTDPREKQFISNIKNRL